MAIGHPIRIKQLLLLDVFLLNGTEIKQSPKSKVLRVITDESLTCDEQYKAVKSKILGGLLALKKLKDILQ